MDIIETLKCVINPITVTYSSNCSERNTAYQMTIIIFAKKTQFHKKNRGFKEKKTVQWVKWVYTRVHTQANPGS